MKKALVNSLTVFSLLGGSNAVQTPTNLELTEKSGKWDSNIRSYVSKKLNDIVVKPSKTSPDSITTNIPSVGNKGNNEEKQQRGHSEAEHRGRFYCPTGQYTVQMDDDAYEFLSKQERDRKSIIVCDTLSHFPLEFYASLQSISLKGTIQLSRGLANRHMIILQTANLSDTEFIAVLVHELGHVVDGGYLVGSKGSDSSFSDGKQVVLTDDISVQFYNLCWSDNQQKKMTAKQEDFVSVYAMANPYEDFAETFVYYVLQGSSFRKKAERNDVLKVKYDYMKNRVFRGKEYGQDDGSTMEHGVLPWDVTQLPYAVHDLFPGVFM